LIIAKEKAEESNRLKTAFVANISHEIRTPLNAIIGFTDIVITHDSSPEEQKVYFDVIKRNSDMLLKLINDILDISQLEAESLQFNKQSIDVVELCNQLLISSKAKGNSENEFELQTNETRLMMEIDINHFQQVLLNLLSNADKFTEKGIIKLQIIAESDEVKFMVKDTGCGIPLEMQTKIFERFVKVDDYKQGSGLGLPICQLTVEKWGGKIWVDPTYTEGTCVIFTHPL
jgi:signal transduction histidine kinase